MEPNVKFTCKPNLSGRRPRKLGLSGATVSYTNLFIFRFIFHIKNQTEF